MTNIKLISTFETSLALNIPNYACHWKMLTGFAWRGTLMNDSNIIWILQLTWILIWLNIQYVTITD